jgi:hypothetical protein
METERSLPCSQEPPLFPILSQMHPVHIFSPYFRKIHSNIIILSEIRSFKSTPPFSLSAHNFIRIYYPSHAFYMNAHLIPLDMTTLTKFVEAYKLWSSSLCSLLQPPATFSLLGTNIHLRSLFSNTRNLCPPLMREPKFHTHAKQEVKLWFCISES